MSSITIDTAIAKRMAEASAIQGASIIGQPGGWTVMLKLGQDEKPLSVQRTDKPRLWRSLDSCVEYLKNELKIARIDCLDATHYSTTDLVGKSRPDASKRLRSAFEASEHDKWFREQVEIALREADDPNTQWLSQEEAEAGWALKRAELVKRTTGNTA